MKLSAFAAPWAIFPGNKPGTSRSIEALNDIFSNKNIQGNELYWISNKRDSHGWQTNSNNVWAHLDAIYGILRTIRNEASTWATNAENNAKLILVLTRLLSLTVTITLLLLTPTKCIQQRKTC